MMRNPRVCGHEFAEAQRRERERLDADLMLRLAGVPVDPVRGVTVVEVEAELARERVEDPAPSTVRIAGVEVEAASELVVRHPRARSVAPRIERAMNAPRPISAEDVALEIDRRGLRPVVGFPGYGISRTGDVFTFWGSKLGRAYGARGRVYASEPRAVVQSTVSGKQRVQLVPPSGANTSRTIERLLLESWGEGALEAYRVRGGF